MGEQVVLALGEAAPRLISDTVLAHEVVVGGSLE
jgi:hypothetical protein